MRLESGCSYLVEPKLVFWGLFSFVLMLVEFLGVIFCLVRVTVDFWIGSSPLNFRSNWFYLASRISAKWPVMDFVVATGVFIVVEYTCGLAVCKFFSRFTFRPNDSDLSPSRYGLDTFETTYVCGVVPPRFLTIAESKPLNFLILLCCSVSWLKCYMLVMTV
jgi:hypothetical protein